MTELYYQNIPPELLEALLDNSQDSQILVDSNGIVRYVGPSDEAFYKVSRKEVIGRCILECAGITSSPRP